MKETSVDELREVGEQLHALKENISELKSLILNHKAGPDAPATDKSGPDKSGPDLPRHESEQTNEINTALAKAQSEYPSIYINRTDKYLGNVYSDLDNIMKKIRPILGSNGISITQITLLPKSGATLLQSKIRHSSGQWIESLERIKPEGNDIDAYRSTMNDMRKNQIMALLNITINNDEFDDNAYEALKPEYEKFKDPVNEQYTYNPKKESYETISKNHLKELQKELAFVPGLEARLLKGLQLRAMADLSESRYETILTNVRDNKEAYLNKKKINLR